MTYEATREDTAALLAWFDRYDAHVTRGDVGAMADMALFPLMVMTDDSAGECATREWDRAAFLAGMAMAAEDVSAIEFDNRRRPVFLSADLAVVVTDSTMTTNGTRTESRYVDVMARAGGEWRFTSMIQSGWGDMLTQQVGDPAPRAD